MRHLLAQIHAAEETGDSAVDPKISFSGIYVSALAVVSPSHAALFDCGGLHCKAVPLVRLSAHVELCCVCYSPFSLSRLLINNRPCSPRCVLAALFTLRLTSSAAIQPPQDLPFSGAHPVEGCEDHSIPMPPPDSSFYDAYDSRSMVSDVASTEQADRRRTTSAAAHAAPGLGGSIDTVRDTPIGTAF